MAKREPYRDEQAVTDTAIRAASRSIQDLFMQMPDDSSLPAVVSRSSHDNDITSTADIDECQVPKLRKGSLLLPRLYMTGATALISFLLTTGLSYALYVTQPAKASVALPPPAVAAPMHVTVADPDFDSLKEGSLNIPETSNPRFDPAQQPINLDTGNRTLSFISHPRGAAMSSFDSMTEPYQSRVPSHVTELGFRPVPNSSGRFLSDDDLQWQGEWELDNAEGNIRRGEGYLNYLKRTFDANVKKSIVARETGTSEVTKTLAAPEAGTGPILRYSE